MRTTVPSLTYTLSGQRLPQFTWQLDQPTVSYSNGLAAASVPLPASLPDCGAHPASARPAPASPVRAMNERRLMLGARSVFFCIDSPFLVFRAHALPKRRFPPPPARRGAPAAGMQVHVTPGPRKAPCNQSRDVCAERPWNLASLFLFKPFWKY